MQQALSRPAKAAPFAAPSDWPVLSPAYDPWDPILSLQQHGRHELTSVELTVTHLCNMRCEHCAVGDGLTMTEAPHLPLDLLFRRLDEVRRALQGLYGPASEATSANTGLGADFQAPRGPAGTADRQSAGASRSEEVRMGLNRRRLTLTACRQGEM